MFVVDARLQRAKHESEKIWVEIYRTSARKPPAGGRAGNLPDISLGLGQHEVTDNTQGVQGETESKGEEEDTC